MDVAGDQSGHGPLMRLEIREGARVGETFDVGSRRVIIGSDADCDFTLSDPEVSGEHASLKTLDGHVEVHDLGSRTGTFVNGTKIVAPTLIGPGDQLKIGSEVLIVSRAPAEAVVASEAGPEAVPLSQVPPAAPTASQAPPVGLPPPTAGATGGRRPNNTLLAIIAAAVVLVVVGVGGAIALSGGSSKPRPTALTAQQVIAHATPSVVRIQGTTGAGSGVVIDAQRQLVLTNAHVVVGNTALKAQLGNDTTTTSPLRLVAASTCDDLAVVKLVTPIQNLKALPLGASASVRAGDAVTVLGFPGSFQTAAGGQQAGIQQASTVVANTGTVSQVNIQASPDPSLPTYQSLIVHQAPTNHGNSGGPLLNQQGQVIGINTLGNPDNQGQYYSIAIDYVKRLLPDLQAGQSHGLLGWNLEQLAADDPNLTPTLQRLYSDDPSYVPDASKLASDTARFLQARPPTTGMYDSGDQPGSPADKSNLAGYLIVSINGTPVRTMSDVCGIVNSASPGQTLRIVDYNIDTGSDSSQLTSEQWIAGVNFHSYTYYTDMKMPKS
jgi:S1-C subfamily serine protease